MKTLSLIIQKTDKQPRKKKTIFQKLSPFVPGYIFSQNEIIGYTITFSEYLIKHLLEIEEFSQNKQKM